MRCGQRERSTYNLCPNAEFVVTSAEVLHERVTAHDHAGAALPFETAHRAEPGLETSVVALDRVVGVPLHPMPRRWDHILDGTVALDANGTRRQFPVRLCG